MGLAPNIPLSGIPTPQPQGPLDMAQKGLNVQALINAVQRQKTEEATAQLQQQQEQIKTQQMQQQQQDLNTIREMAPKYVGKDANGNGTFDFNGLATDAQGKGVSPSLLNNMMKEHYAMVTERAKAGSESLANELAHNKAQYEVLEGLRTIKDPDERLKAASTGINKLSLMGMDTSHLTPQSLLDDKALDSAEMAIGMHGQQLSDAKTLAETNEKNATAAEKEWQKFPELGVMVNTKTNEQRSVAGGPVIPPAMLESKWLAIQQKKNLGQPVSADEAAFSKSFQQYKELIPQFNFNLSGGATGGMTPQAIDAQAEKYFQTGTLPPAGRGPAGIAFQRQIMQRANDLHPGENLAASSASFAANKKSLNELQPKLDQVTSFENTSLKNLDLFTGIAQKAIDSGLPIVNAPLRAAASMLGGQDQAAFNAARQVAVNEIAKVTSSPGLSGQLSDNARHEVENFIPATATVGQIMRVASVLKQDMENRRISYQEQIGDIQKRLGGASGANSSSLPKSLTAEQITAYAKAHNVPEAEVKRQAKAKGIAVPEP
jgi:hypothetical protein